MEEPSLLADRPGPLPRATSPRRPSLAKRALTLAKYLPAALCGLLVVAWVVSAFAEFGVLYQGANQGAGIVGCAGGSIQWLFAYEHSPLERYWTFQSYRAPKNPWYWLGELDAEIGRQADPATDHRYSVPISVLLTLLLPFAIGCLNRFRFPLWSWFAWTALIAVELAYYLR